MDYLGNMDILNNHKTAFLCSRKCPAEIVLNAYDWAIKMRNTGNCVISGFHSRIEKDVLKYLLKGTQPLIIVLARGMKKRFSYELKKAIEQERLLVVAPFDEKVKRVTEETAYIRNKYMLELAEEVYVPYYTKGGIIEQAMMSLGKNTFKFKEEM
jgi:predicted Rossmann fold nucleotide-binding protein DprA/Smf involved in DNA uptake